MESTDLLPQEISFFFPSERCSAFTSVNLLNFNMNGENDIPDIRAGVQVFLSLP